MTEEEAKTKWCPMVRFHVIDRVGFDNTPTGRDGCSDTNVNCIGSACMMFRQYEIRVPDNPPGTPVFNTHGYCGLAGKP